LETFTIAVAEVNTSPTLGAIGNKSVDEQATLSFTATATDQDTPTQTLTYSLDAVSLAAGMTITPTGAFSWTPSEAQGDVDYSVTITVTDDGTGTLSDSETFKVTVNEVNVAPVLDAIGDRAVDEQTALSFTATANGQDLPVDTLTFSLDAASLAVGMTIDPTSGALAWTPTEEHGPDQYPVTVTVTDDGNSPLSDSKSFQITVNDPEVLTLVLNADSISEAAGSTATVATVSRGEYRLDQELTIQVQCDDDSEVTVPEEVVIPANESSMTFEIDAVDDYDADGTQVVQITVGAAGFAGDAKTLDVTDHESWQSPTHKFDVNRDREITPTDVFYVITFLNVNGAVHLPIPPNPPLIPPPFVDCNDDGDITPTDLLLLISDLNANGARRVDNEGGVPVAASGAEGEAMRLAPMLPGTQHWLVAMADSPRNAASRWSSFSAESESAYKSLSAPSRDWSMLSTRTNRPKLPLRHDNKGSSIWRFDVDSLDEFDLDEFGGDDLRLLATDVSRAWHQCIGG
jgi:hypothetical protein